MRPIYLFLVPALLILPTLAGAALAEALGEQALSTAWSRISESLGEERRQEILNKALLDAAWRGDRAEIARLLALGADPRAKDGFSRTGLDLSAIRGFTPIMEDLLAKAPDLVVAQGVCGYTALEQAAPFGQVAAMQLLLSRGAVVDAKTCLGETALSIAAHNGQSDALAFLLGAKADPNPVLYDGATPLINAVKQGRDPIVDILLGNPRVDVNKAVANPGAENGMTALKYAVKQDAPWLVAKLLAAPGVDVNEASGGVTALFLAKVVNDQAVIDLLVKAGARD